jgi:hypothetical protein
LETGEERSVQAKGAEEPNAARGELRSSGPLVDRIPPVKWGFIDNKGRLVIAARFTSADNFRNGLARVRQDNYHGYIDKSGKWVIRATD